jgi:hypothetical protein
MLIDSPLTAENMRLVKMAESDVSRSMWTKKPERAARSQAATETIGILAEEAQRRARALQGKGPTTNEGRRSVSERK